MARYKPIDTSPRFLAVDLERQLLPGTFEHALNHSIDREPALRGLIPQRPVELGVRPILTCHVNGVLRTYEARYP